MDSSGTGQNSTRPIVAILAGGRGSRLAEETQDIPKPLVTIGDKPILHHIIDYYAAFGFAEFVIALGYKHEKVTKYFDALPGATNGFHPDADSTKIRVPSLAGRSISVNLVNTGPETNTGGRVKRLRPYIGNKRFMLTWCDGLSDVPLDDLLRFHQGHGKLATVTAVKPPPRFGRLTLEGNKVTRFSEKPIDDKTWINGAFFVLEPNIFELIEDDKTSFERGSLADLSLKGELMGYLHHGYWQCMDTIHDRHSLEDLWSSGNAPWIRSGGAA